ncbi:MAG: Hpt domain-containing protein [Deltaproteobacteria bacterium]|nr:Hpt domain-containing protein [Deltaproteobacteria bacterium]
MDPFLSLFVEESQDHLDTFERAVPSLGRDTEAPEAVKAMFRAAHSLKGTARMMGFGPLGDLTHLLEELLAGVRDGRISVTAPLLSALLHATDTLRLMTKKAQLGEALEEACRGGLRTTLGDFLQTGSSSGSSQGGLPLLHADAPLGELLVMEGLLAPEALDAVLARQPRIGELLVQEGLVPEHAVLQLLERQQRARAEKTALTTRVSAAALDELSELVEDLHQRLSGGTNAPQSDDLVAKSERIRERLRLLRLVPIATLFERARRLVRTLQREQGVRVRLRTLGEDLLVDKCLVEHLGAPMEHLIRNAVVHGLEDPEERRASGKAPVGTVSLRATVQQGELRLDVQDDGRGVDRERVWAEATRRGWASERPGDERALLSLLFRPGFSTVSAPTSLAGRGVGLDAVKTEVDKLGGRVEVTSIAGTGSRFRLTAPTHRHTWQHASSDTDPSAGPPHMERVALRAD